MRLSISVVVDSNKLCLDSSYKHKVDKAILKLNADGTMSTLQEKWFPRESACIDEVAMKKSLTKTLAVL